MKAERRAAVRPTAEQVPAAAKDDVLDAEFEEVKDARTAKLACIGPTGG